MRMGVNKDLRGRRGEGSKIKRPNQSINGTRDPKQKAKSRENPFTSKFSTNRFWGMGCLDTSLT